MPDIRLAGLVKRFGDFAAVDHIDLEIAHGEFFTMLGPSGSGKTTTLRLIAGFDVPDAGRVELAGEDVARRPPFERDVNTVFQDYALFPHMSVLRQRRLRAEDPARSAKAERRRRAQEALEMVRLPDVGGRRPAQLSGGQRQRVALARAIVNRPRVLLLDEPLGALDLKLREEMQVELKQIQSEVGITFVYVTHDQDEALSMSDRIAVFNNGRIEQVGTPAEVYERPLTEFVAGFVGVSNMLERDGRRFTIRPEKIRILADGDADARPARRARHGHRRELRRPGHALRDRAGRRAGACSSPGRTLRRRTTRPAICAGVRCASAGARTRRSPSAVRTHPPRRRQHEAHHRVRRSGDRRLPGRRRVRRRRQQRAVRAPRSSRCPTSRS